MPQGFSFAYDKSNEDHHLLQVASHLDHAEAVRGRQRDDRTFFPGGAVDWISYGVFKDKAVRRYRVEHSVVALSGDRIAVINPPFAVTPREKVSCGDVPGKGEPKLQTVMEGTRTVTHSVRERERTMALAPITRDQFKYAVPVLSGWDVHFICENDEQISEIGVWLTVLDFDFLGAGTLRYLVNSVMRDADFKPAHEFRTNELILGVLESNPDAGTIMPIDETNEPDLLPLHPILGADGDCLRTASGELIIPIQNRGARAAGATVTRVVGEDPAVALAIQTAGIAANSTENIVAGVPSSLLETPFRIIADAATSVPESDEMNNSIPAFCSP